MITVLGKRRRQHGVGISNIQLEQGDWRKPVDKKQLKRYINDSIRAERPLSIRPGMYVICRLPKGPHLLAADLSLFVQVFQSELAIFCAFPNT